LASASPRRRDLLSDAGYDVLIAASDVEEMDSCHEGPEALAVINAERKWDAVAPQYPDEVVVAADTVVWLDGRFYGKPVDFAEATEMLTDLSGRTHQVVTGVVLGRAGEGIQEFAEVTWVTFHTLPPDEIAAYLKSIHPLDKAGAYAAQDDNGRLIAKVDGSISNVIGLPMEKLGAFLASENYRRQK
jgi:septum formation protein